MQTKKLIIEVDFTKTLQDLTQVYKEAAVMRMQKIREKVLQSRSFAEELAVLFGDVNASYKESLFQKLKKSKQLSFVQKRKKLAVLIAPEGKLSGDILAKVFQKFSQEIKQFSGSILVVGKLGKQLVEEHNVRQKCTFFDFPNSQTDPTYSQLITTIAQYDEITLYHGQFVNLMQQVPHASQIKGENIVPKTSQKPATITHYLYEPHVDAVMEYFEKQIFATVFQQRLQESQLAQLGARIKAMENASSNISDRLRDLHRYKKINRQLHENKKQLERLTGVALVEGMV
ncbi:MAG: F0F1 ATP synthase subunit gamma [Patescibacteria group bacterium]